MNPPTQILQDRILATRGDTHSSVEEYREINNARRPPVVRAKVDSQEPIIQEEHEPQTKPLPLLVELLPHFIYNYLIIVVVIGVIVLLIFGWGRQWEL